MADILICDDEPHIIRAVEIKLKRAGHAIESQLDGRAAWDALLDRLATDRPMPDLIITDCQMPRMTGLQLAAAIKSDPRLDGLPILMLTAKGFELSADELREKLGIHRVIGKPFSPRELAGIVDETLTAADGMSAATLSEPSVHATPRPPIAGPTPVAPVAAVSAEAVPS